MPFLARLLFSLFLVVAASAAATAADLSATIADAKAHLGAKRYDAAVIALQAAVPTAADLTNPVERAQALAALHFYTAVAFDGLGNEAKAKEQLQQFLTFAPAAQRLDPKKYRASLVRMFDEVRATSSSEIEPLRHAFESLYPEYRSFSTERAKDVPADKWVKTPEYKHLATKEEKRRWNALHDLDGRRRFIDAFWKARDSAPETDRNEYRELFEQRVAFADRAFAFEETRGSMTDRGRVFILLGKPAAAKRRPIVASDRVRVFDPGIVINGAIELWAYERGQLPAGHPKPTMNVRFVTQRGIGDNVLQREDPYAVQLLAIAAEPGRGR